MTELSVEIGEFENEDDDDDEIKEEELKREQELNGILSTAFDDLSSVTEDEDTGDEEQNESGHSPTRDTLHNGCFEGSSWPLFKAGLTSTPRYPIAAIQRKSSRKNYVSTHQVIDEHSDFGSENGNSLDLTSCSSVEKGRATVTNFSRNATVHNFDFSSKHIQLLLDDNEKLRADLASIKQMLSVKNGDCEALRHKCCEYEKELKSKDEENITLIGKLAAVELQLKSEVEAKDEFCRKLAIAEATIEPLQKQISELSKNDNLVRVREAHEALVSKLKDDYENEIYILNEEIAKLKWNLETKTQELSLLNLRPERISTSFEGESTLKDMISKKDETIDSLQKEVKDLNTALNKLREDQKKSEISPISLKKDNVCFSSVICDLKCELEEALKNGEMRREQNNALQKELKAAKDEVNKVKKDIQNAYILRDQHNEEMKRLENEISSLKQNVFQSEKKIAALKDFEQKCTQLDSEVNTLTHELSEFKLSYARICNEKMEIELAYNRILKDLKDHLDFNGIKSKQLKEMVNISTELWKKEIEVQFSNQMKEELQNIREQCVKEKTLEMKKISEKYQSDLQNQISFILTHCLDFVQNNGVCESICKSSDFNALLKPLQDFCVGVEKSYKEKEALLIKKTIEMRQAREQLEAALRESQQDTIACHKCEQMSDLNIELQVLREQLSEYKKKLDKYKKHYHLLAKKVSEANEHGKNT